MTGTTASIHVVLGDHAAAALRSAIADHGVPGGVHCIPDDLGHGPLHDGVARLAYMRECFAGFDDWTHPQGDAFASWHALASELQREQRDVAVWAAQNVSEGVLLAMACWWLRGGEAKVHVVEPPNGRHVGRHAPPELAILWRGARALTASGRNDQARVFEHLRDAPHQRRQWLADRIAAVPDCAFDHLLIEEIKPEWQPASRIVGRAMCNADPRDGLSDVYLSRRLHVLIGNGIAEADRPPLRLRDYAVRYVTV